MKILYIGYDFSEKNSGAKLLSYNINRLLKNICEDTDEYILTREKNLKDILIKNLKRETSTLEEEREVLKLIEEKKYTTIFIDMSYFGELTKKIKLTFPQVHIVTFFHNVEIKYAKERVRVEGVTRIIALPRVVYQERMSVKYSDCRIVLNKRDHEELGRRYGYESEIIPMFMEDRYREKEENRDPENYLLFVGSLFYANIEGLDWFVKKILPLIDVPLKVVGKDMETLIDNYAYETKLEIVGTVEVEELESAYNNALAVVAPILSGSGMKTKSVEALMFGKTLIGTEEALVGIEGAIEANTPEEFVEAIKKLKKESFDKNSRENYLKNYSFQAVENRLKEVLK